MDNAYECRELVDFCTPARGFADIRNMPIDQFLSEFNVNTACQAVFCSMLRNQAERLLLEERKLFAVQVQKDALLHAKDEEIERLKSEAFSSTDAVAKVERLRSLLKSVKSAHAIELSSLKEQSSMFEAELHEQSSAFEKEHASVDAKLLRLQSSLVKKDLEISGLCASLIDSHHVNESLRRQVFFLLLLTIYIPFPIPLCFPDMYFIPFCFCSFFFLSSFF